MKAAPFLLQAFTARVLAEKREERLLRADLVKQGYDVDMLLEMIAAYQNIPDAERAFTVTVSATQICLKRKPNAGAPPIRPVSGSTTPPMVNLRSPVGPTPAPQIKLSDVVRNRE